MKNQRLTLLFLRLNMMSREPAEITGLQQAFPYPRSASGATTDLAARLICEIKKSGPIPFSEYMARCLYDPELGYYARPEGKTVSKEGDFMTSVSVGPVFGALLARRIYQFWTTNGSPTSFVLLELGAHDGSLALDILAHLRFLPPEFSAALSYTISEPLPARRKTLRNRLPDSVNLVWSPSEIQANHGAIIANEVLDALPLPLYLFTENKWHEVMVTTGENSLEWALRETKTDLPTNYPDGYVTEGPPDFHGLLLPLSKAIENSLSIWIDYGLDQESLYHPARSAGTFRCYRRHRSDAHPLDFPGKQDLTADVNFTAVEKAATQLGFEVHPTMSQSRYLTYAGRDWLLSNPSRQEISQFQTLIHPSQFGNRFHALELTRGEVTRAFP